MKGDRDPRPSLGVLTLVAVLSGCGSDVSDRADGAATAGAGGAGGELTGGTGGAHDEGGTTGGTAGQSTGGSGGTGECNELALAPAIQCSSEATAPLPAGGTIPTGTYHLVRWESSNCPVAKTLSMARKVVAAGTSSYDVEQAAANWQSMVVRANFVAATSGTTVTFTPSCGELVGASNEYSAYAQNGKDMLMVVAGASTVFVFERVGN